MCVYTYTLIPYLYIYIFSHTCSLPHSKVMRSTSFEYTYTHTVWIHTISYIYTHILYVLIPLLSMHTHFLFQNCSTQHSNAKQFFFFEYIYTHSVSFHTSFYVPLSIYMLILSHSPVPPGELCAQRDSFAYLLCYTLYNIVLIIM